MSLFVRLCLIGLAGLSTACGGGGGSSSNTPPAVSSVAAVSSVVSVVSSSVSSSSAQSTTSSASSSLPSVAGLPVSEFIVVDQFGYLPELEKVAVIRNPQNGFDAASSFTPGTTYQLVNLGNGNVVKSGQPVVWNEGAVGAASGDRAWWFDFSDINTVGDYVVVDTTHNLRSAQFRIAPDVYKPVLKHAFRTFFYQRAGFAKELPYAEAGWTDGASHIRPGQDKQARLFTEKSNAITERDLSGGWYDAGDYNKYTNWHADYLVSLLHTWRENPAAWGDDFNIPESGNGISDLIDEIKWGFDWLIKMQNPDGSVLSILGLSHASPPSSASGPSYYGPASTSATLSSAAAFAFGSRIFGSLDHPGFAEYAADLKQRSQLAWQWASANPAVVVRNNEGIYSGLGAGQQEVDDAGRVEKRVLAAIYLYDITGESSYKVQVENRLNADPVNWVSHWNEPKLISYLYYSGLPGVSASLADTVRSGYRSAMNSADNWGSVRDNREPYRAFMAANDFTWGSNRSMSRRGTLFTNLASFALEPSTAEMRNAGLRYLNYLHGVNPLGMVYVSNMSAAGAHHSVNEFYHSWFTDGSSQWDRVGVSAWGPAPGFLVGGPNPSYDWDSCCPSSCGSVTNNNICSSITLTPPKNQPAMKSYLDFNNGWPLNSWQVTENHNDYQVAYLRLLSKYMQ
ncbi:glycoside hydrolase family 9 protein [Cellvibrio polysaccharolyticus]|uniref:LacI family transcriptional regulator n=1 Tax=Cellvibrio polysaccharolyticus TaxID=2082724 RepID=A0A928YS67_9GAMM|nr:glycoside hydrolase family 9 protein [Cellvibrio polysaccharolyticus]MBE8715694.1 LacI family transcriptional regulator [Cellvibrio polysaccharolyticus]